jgi:hypothetical protein
MKKHLAIGLSILMLICVVGGTIFWTRAFYESIQNFQSPLRGTDLLPQLSALPKTTRVVVVLISGLGYDAAQELDLPVLGQLTQTGTSAVVQSWPPTYSQTAQATLITGAPPETNGVPPIDRPVEDLSLIEADTIFARAHEAQLKTALVGTAEWQRLIPRNHLDETFFVNTSGPEADQAILDIALTILKNGDIDLVFIHFTQLNYAAKHQGGPFGSTYGTAASRIDAYLEQISRVVDPRSGVLIIMSDHGHIASGGHGGGEIEVTRQPLVINGKNIVPGSYSDVSQTDIAPTISTLLGAAPPTAAQGRILFEMLRLSEHDQTVAQLALAQQRITLAEAYLAEVKDSSTTLPDAIFADLAQAQTAFTQKNISGAFQLALLAQEEADNQVVTARRSQIWTEQWPRLLGTMLVMLGWFIVMWRRRGFHAGLIVVATVVTIGLYHILFQLQGYSYTISSLGDFSELPFDIARRAAVSILAGGGLVLVVLMLANEGNWAILLKTGYGFSLLTTFVFALPLAWAFWQNGFVVDWYLPEVQPAFWQITGLFEVMIVAILGFLLPWPIMLLNLFVNLVRRQLDETRPQSEPDALPGLRL